MRDDRTTEQRLTSLERFAAAVAVRQVGEDQLAEGVGRLSNETNSLNAILTKVDEQQRYLQTLDKRTELVEETAVSRDELINAHDQQEQESFEFRKKTLNRIYLSGMLITLGLAIAAGAFIEVQDRNDAARYKVCSDRNEQDDILYDILVGFVNNVPPGEEESPNVKLIRDSIERLEDKVVDCEALLR